MLDIVKVLITEIQTVDSGIGAHFYPDKNLITFWKNGIILDKVQINEKDFLKPNFIQMHKQRVIMALHSLQNMKAEDFNNLKRQVQNLKPGKLI